MDFETVHVIPDPALKRRGETKFLTKEDLSNLVEHSQLYFLRNSNSLVLHDYPVRGGYEKRLQSSMIDGPFVSAPKIKEQERLSESTNEVLELLVPTSLMPVDFENVHLIEYGTQTDDDSLRHLRLVGSEIDPKRIMKIGENILSYLHGKGHLEQVSNFQYRTSLDDCLVEFTLSDNLPYPAVSIALFGIDEIPQQLVDELRSFELEKQFAEYNRDVGMQDSTRKGLAYLLSLNGKAIPQVVDSPNVVI